MKLMTLAPVEQKQRSRGERIRHMLRLLLAYSGSHSLADIGIYMRLCSHADALKQRGFVVRMRGKKKRWLIEITGGKQALQSSDSSLSTKRPSSHVLSLQQSRR